MPEKGKLTMAEVKFWLSEAKNCVDRQRIELIERNKYPFLINYFEGIEISGGQYPHVGAETKMMIISEYFPNTNSLISEIIYQNPEILTEAMNPQAEADEDLMRSAVNYAFDKSGVLIENRVGLFDMLYAGYCAVEVDQINASKPKEEIDEEPQEEEPEGIFDKIAAKWKKAKNAEEAEKNLADMSPQMETNFATVQGTYFRRYDPLDVPLDWRAERVQDRRYNLKKVWMSKAEFDSKYPKFKDKVNVQEEKFDYARHGLDIHNRKVMLYEFQVRLRGNVYRTIVISPSYLFSEIDAFDRPYTTNGFNMKIGTLHKYGKLYPVSMAKVNKTMQDEMNKYVRHMMEVAQRNIPKRTYDRNKLKADGIEALRSKNVNDLVPVDGNVSGAIETVQPTNVSLENKELLSIFQDQKNKLWSVSESRISGRAQAKFATDLAIQEEGFEARQSDIQEGLRDLIQQEAETAKDLIVNFWDGEVFLKITGKDKVGWYEPQYAPDPNNPGQVMITNPLTDLLKGDYFIKVDVASAARPNRSQQLQQMIFFMQQIVQMREVFIDQGYDINIDEIRRVSKDFGWNPDALLVQHNPAGVPSVPAGTGETLSPEEDARRQAEAERRLNERDSGANV